MEPRLLDRFRLDGRTALVTGAAQGIGRGYALALAEAGADVAVVDLQRELAEGVAAEIEARGRRALVIAADVTRASDVAAMVATVMGAWQSLDIGVNNVGGGRWIDAADYSEAEWDSHLRLNLTSVFLCAQAEAQVMLRQGRGSIINTASISGLIVNRGTNHAAYNAAKAGVVHLTRCLAAEWAPRGIRVNAISPGNIRTPAAERPEVRPWLETWATWNPLGRVGEVADLQGAVVFLAADASAFITGHNLVVDGGYTIW